MVNIYCKGCQQDKGEENFYLYTQKNGTISRRKTCNKCRSRQIMKTDAYKRAHEKAKKKSQDKKIEIVELFGNKCYVCKQTFPPCVFDFHHKNSTEKEHNIASLLRFRDHDQLETELNKCIMLCSNCHRIKHHNRGD